MPFAGLPRPLLSLPLLGVLACSPIVIGSGSGSGSGGSGAGGGQGQWGGGPMALAMTEPQAEKNMGPASDDWGASPDLLFVVVTSYGNTCDGVFTPPDTCGDPCVFPTVWIAGIGIPPGTTVPGTYSLGGVAAPAWDEVDGTTDGVPSESGGVLDQGSIDIVSIDDTQVVFGLKGALLDPYDAPGVSADGQYTAVRCPQ